MLDYTKMLHIDPFSLFKTEKEKWVLKSQKVLSKYHYEKFKLVRYPLKENYSDIINLLGSFGVFTEISVQKIDDLVTMFENYFQTLSYFGIEKNYINEFIKNNRLLGIDRLVPIGRAFDIGPVWDGYDVIRSLSRIISN